MRKRKRGSACANISREINGFLTVSRTTEMINQQWHAATTTRHCSLTYQFLTDLQTFD